jgi:hypothetical protein
LERRFRITIGEHGENRLCRAGGLRDSRLSAAWWWIGVAAVVLSALSFVVVMMTVSQEPYFGGIRAVDAIIQVGVGTALIVLWALWSVVVIAVIVRKRTHAATLAVLIWAAMCVFYLGNGVVGYLDDITLGSDAGRVAATSCLLHPNANVENSSAVSKAPNAALLLIMLAPAGALPAARSDRRGG